jgi:hypothetical protein
MTNVMTPTHPRWHEFVGRVTEAMAGPAATAGGTGSDLVDAALRGCNGHGRGNPFESSRPVLVNMGMDIEASLAFFAARGGSCDCEVMLNIAEPAAEQDDEDT